MEAQFDKNTCMNYRYSTQNVAHFRLKNNIYMYSYLTLSLSIKLGRCTFSLFIFLVSELSEPKWTERGEKEVSTNSIKQGKYTAKNIWKSYIWTADKDVNESDTRGNVHYLSSSENKAWKKFRPVRDLNPDLCDTGAPNFFQALFSLLLK